MTWRPHLDKLAFLTALLAVYTGEILQASPLPLMVNDTATARNMLITSQLNKIVSYFIIANFSENPFAVYNLFQEINLGRIFRRQYKGAVAFSSVPRLSSPRWRCVWPWLFFSFFFHWLLHKTALLHPDSTDSKQSSSASSDTTVPPCRCACRCVQLGGNDEAVSAQCVHASLGKSAPGGSDIPGGERG